MNELDKAHLQKRLSELYDQRSKEFQTMKEDDEDLGMETGYVTDSSINSRKGAESSSNSAEQNMNPSCKSRKTKSERDKRRSSRVSLLESKVDSADENSPKKKTEEKQHRYRKRAGSKRVEINANSGDKENLDIRRKRAGSKNASQNINDENKNKDTKDQVHQTMKMNSKDIYCGTWNPTERAVLDQVLNNIDGKSPGKKSFMEKLKWSNNNKEKCKGKEKYEKIEENIEEECSYEQTNESKDQKSSSENNQKKTKTGLFRKLKDSVKQRHAALEEAYIDKQLQNYGVSPSPSQKKKGILSRLSSSKKKEVDGGRCRTHSSNDYTRSVGVFIQPQEPIETIKENHKQEKSNMTRSKSGSIKNLFMSSKAKSMDNLNGAFQYYANPKQVFQRTPSMSKLNSRSTSMEKLDQTKRSASQKSLDHAFEPVKYTAKELCYNDPFVYAQTRFAQPQKVSHPRNLNYLRQQSSDGYCSAYDDYYRGYQSDVSPSLPMTYGHQYRHFNFDIPYPYSDTERPQSSMSPGYFPTPPQRRMPPHVYYRHNQPTPQHHLQSQTPPLSPYFMPAQYIPPTHGYYTPGYATPGAMYPHSGYETPSGYTSESDYGYVRSPLFLPPQPPPPPPQLVNQNTTHALPFQARKAIQRSLSKNSSNSNYSGNYGYGSESSFCEDEIYSMVRPPMQNYTPSQFYEQRTNSSQTSRTSQLSTDV